MQLRTNFDSEALHPRDKDVGCEEPAHRLAPVDSELPAVQILVDVGRVPIVASHRSGYIAVVVVAGVIAVHLRRG